MQILGNRDKSYHILDNTIVARERACSKQGACITNCRQSRSNVHTAFVSRRGARNRRTKDLVRGVLGCAISRSTNGTLVALAIAVN